MSNIPLFWCLSSKSQAVLMQYQQDNYGEKLEIVDSPISDVEYPIHLENIEEIARLMRQAPSRSHE